MPEPITHAAVADLVALGIEEVLSADEPYDLVGFSFGAAVAGPLALLHGDRLRSLVLVGPGGLGRLRPRVALRPPGNQPDAEARAEIQRQNLGQLMFADEANIDELAVRLQAENVGRARVRSRRIAPAPVLADALPQISVPVAAIFGELDATLWPHLDERLAQLRLLRPDMSLHVIPGAGHWVQYEAHPAFDAVLRDVLDGAGSV